MTSTNTFADRAYGVLLGTAVGDALGVPYEFESIRLPAEESPRMLGGGLGDFAPGEWSDDTSMALAVAQAAATGADLTSDAGLDMVAAGFLRWFDTDPPDVGNQTRAVLSQVRGLPEAGLGAAMTAASAAYVEARPGQRVTVPSCAPRRWSSLISTTGSGSLAPRAASPTSPTMATSPPTAACCGARRSGSR